MIVTRITGGLGNQLFQYAFGQYLAAKHQTELVLDGMCYEEDAQRVFVLDRFHIAARLATPEIRRLCLPRYGGLGVMNYLRFRRPLRRLKEAVYGFKPEYLEAKDHTYLEGYWQSEKFFPGMLDRLRREFQPSTPLSQESRAMAQQMERGESVSLHVRRTDYLNLEYTEACSKQYYHRCVEHLAARYSGVRLFVFSDDSAWCQQELRFRTPAVFVTHNDAAGGHEDLWLMSRCRHHIVANSTFSWWGARLGVDPAGETLAPDPWFTNPQWDGSSIVPPSWRRVSVESASSMAA